MGTHVMAWTHGHDLLNGIINKPHDPVQSIPGRMENNDAPWKRSSASSSNLNGEEAPQEPSKEKQRCCHEDRIQPIGSE